MASVVTTNLEIALNRYLRLDPEGLRGFAELEGKVIAVELREFNKSIYFLPAADRIRVLDQYDGEPDTRFCGTLLTLAKLGIDPTIAPAGLFSDDMEIRGDIDTGRRFKELLDAVEVDWEEPLARVCGDVFAHQAGNTFRQARQWASRSFRALKSDLSEFLTEEARLLPTKIELENLFVDVDEIHMAVDRLEARLRRLHQHRSLQTGGDS